MSCQPAHPHFPRATRGALNALLRPAVPRSRSVSPFEDQDLHPAERVVVMAAEGHPDLSILTMFDECFMAETVLPKAILISTPGVSLTALRSESDFLEALKDERDSLGLGAIVAWSSSFV